MFSIDKMKKLEEFLFKENIGCIFKQIYLDQYERLFIEYSGYSFK